MVRGLESWKVGELDEVSNLLFFQPIHRSLSNSPTIQLSNLLTIQPSNSPTFHLSNLLTIQPSNSPTF